jgi:hypothetical protein
MAGVIMVDRLPIGCCAPVCPECGGNLRYVSPIGDEWIIQFVDLNEEDVGLVRNAGKGISIFRDCLLCKKCTKHFNMKLKTDEPSKS